ncbi:MAG: translocation/assembly module TamB domain-containing protein [Saprospiraceae bacterium]
MDELTQWIPSLAKNAFFTKYKNQTIQLQGNLGGTLNEFRSNRMSIKLEKAFDFDGRIDVSDITKPDELFLSLRINALNTHAYVLKDLVKGLSNLKNFDHLGDINFRGSFDGSFKDFVAYGVLKTDVGSSKMDMRLKTTKDIDQAKYSGEIELIDFNLGKWTGNTKLGLISLQATITDGSGLRAESASAKFKSDIRKLEYNGYTYSNVLFDGVLNRKLIDGTVTIKDENANLDFVGKIDFTNEIPAYDFEATIRKLDFHALKWTNQSISISGNTDIAVKGKSLEELAGQIKLEHFIIQKDSTMILLENLELNASTDDPGNQKLNLESDWISGEISGKYTLKDIWPSLKNQLKIQFPDITKSLKLNEKLAIASDSIASQAFRYSFVFKDIRGISNLLGLKMSSTQPFKIEGELNEKTKYILTTWNIPDFQFNDLSITNAVGRMEAKGAIAFASSYIDSTINKNIHLPRIILTTDLSNNKLNFSIKTPKVGNVVNNVSLNGYIELIDSTYRLHFASSQVSFLERNWDILPDNEIAFRPGFIQTKSLRFVSGDEKIEFTSVGSRGLKVEIANLSIDWANAFLPMKAWNFSGKINLRAEAADAFDLQGLKVAGLIDSIFINKSYFGLLDINAYTPNVNQPINVSLSMLDGTKQLLGQGFYDINGTFSKGIKNNYQFKFVFKDYPLRLFEFLIDDIVDNTIGNIQGNLEISKLNDKPNFSGKITIKEGGLKVNYLGTTYRIGTQPILITNSMIDVSGVQLKDELGNDGTLRGGILHDHFKGFSLNAGLSSNRFLILKTTKEQNPDYYGTLVGNINARFHGEFNAIDMDVQGITARPSFLSIPISQATVITSDRIVAYRPRTSVTDSDTSKPKRLLASKGISVSIDLTVNNDAEIALIFDEKKGDILKGTGNGDLQMRFGRNGGITMYGNYEVDQGEYLFTLLGVVNKPFKIKQGGTIRWDGDPLAAQIDLNAEYKGLSSSLIILLPEYESTLGSNALRTQASVDLGMHLYGVLFKPEISFSIDIPNLSGDLRSIVDNKLNLLKSDQNALNQQVLGLMVWGSFLPPNQLVASSGVLGSTINNLSQFISSQLSLLVENALKELVADNSVISGFDFDVNYYNNSNVVDINNASVFDEFNLNLAPKFFEDRLSVGLGANFVNSSLFDRLITPHFEVEYSITKDRQLKIRAYARKDEINQGQLKDRIGGGISWRKEFDSFKDFKKQLKNDLEQKPLLGPSLQ